jgi:rhodanese-related sulfurtransferase
MFGRAKRETTIADFATAHAAGAVTVDVREPGEYVTGHVPGAFNVPLGRLGEEAARLVAEAGGAPVYVICASGHRSKAGASVLARAGGEALSVAGGTGAWTRAGHRVVTGSRVG